MAWVPLALAAVHVPVAAAAVDLWGRPWGDFMPKDNTGGGTDCAACTIVTGLVEQRAILFNTTADEVPRAPHRPLAPLPAAPP